MFCMPDDFGDTRRGFLGATVGRNLGWYSYSLVKYASYSM